VRTATPARNGRISEAMEALSCLCLRFNPYWE